MSRETLLARTFVELADTLVDDFDVVELLTLLADRCVDVLDVAAAGLMLASPEGELRVMASSSDAARVLELFELEAREGPCVDCYRSGAPVVNQNLANADGRWPQFARVAIDAGFHSAHAIPMRLRGSVIGALNLFRTDEGEMREADMIAAQAFADVATIGILQHRAVRETHVVNEQLIYALNSRIIIEQAKGVLAERAALDVEEAFVKLRDYARSHNAKLVDVAHAVVEGRLTDLPGPNGVVPPAEEIDDGETVWRFDTAFLRSNWSCIWGRGCIGILDRPAPELGQGCCSIGAELEGPDEPQNISALAATLEPWIFEHHVEATDGGIFGNEERSKTRVVDGACIFLNRPGFAGGAGCALHLAALAADESPTEWKPSVCWQLPIKVDWAEGQDGREVATVRGWTRADWGEQGETMAWCCTEGDLAYVGDRPVIDSLGEELAEIVGHDVYVELRRRVEAD